MTSERLDPFYTELTVNTKERYILHRLLKNELNRTIRLKKASEKCDEPVETERYIKDLRCIGGMLKAVDKGSEW